MLKNKALIAPLGLVGITILSGVFLMSSITSATDNTDVVDEVNITVPISCSMEGTGMNSHNANIVNGTYQADIGSTTLKVFCNDEEGFAIFAAGYTGDEIGGTNSTKLVNSASAVDNTISTGTATSGNTSNWAMKLATNSSATYTVTLDNGFGAYSSVPSAYTKVAHRDSGTDIGTTAIGAELTTTYAAFVDQTQPAGTYVGKVIYTLVHPANEEPPHEIACEAGKICYNPNTTTALGEMGKQTTLSVDSSTTITNGSSVTLWTPNYKRDGYGFAGWNTKYDYTGANYGPSQNITAPDDVESNGLSLYAMWVPSQGILQNWNGCSSMSIGDVTALTDNRDNDTYAVAKLADGKCWMIENLRLDSAPELTATNTHNPLLPITNSDSSTSNHLSASISYPDNAWYKPNISMIDTDNITDFSSNTPTNYNAMSDVYGYGVYYNWYSATAGHGKSGVDYNASYVAPGDICPAGWRLPTGFSNGDFGVLNDAINNGATDYAASNVLRFYPNNFVLAGSAAVNTARGLYGFYWTSYSSGQGTAWCLFFVNGTISPGTNTSNKETGNVMRCINDV